ncbi:unnamed protein product [Trichobilharzia regenti]|nr:unnamed protein product [Trichobilharzia regenti]
MPFPQIKLLGAPLHKLVKFTESSPNSKEITKKLLSKSHWSSLTTQSTSNATKNASISDSSYSPVTSNNNNNSPVNIESNNEFSLPEFITLSKLIPYKQPTLSTTKINKPDDINSKYSPTLPVNTRGFDTSFNINSEINTEVNSIKDRMEYKISNPHRLKRSDRCSTYNKYPLSSSVTGVSSSNATSNTISSGDNSSINNSDNLTFNDCSSSATKSFDQKTWINPTDNDNELLTSSKCIIIR